ncbi:amino acid ABC transporter permease [Brucella pseudogrignonensis]|uniref:amino acid ABC transporter permease n=1 Tax=Brucella pseudogrignonensis TaxID=419475 RepID=UPI0028BCCD19|nr:amino acid ABC transporter permease [Brucella pseudogrignonensis]MDT6942569.1 amino acid ABC transporter permease [Brucella pseudogrignonensis]
MFNSLGLIHFQYLLNGALWTIVLSTIAFSGGAVGGIVLALLRISPSTSLRIISRLYIQTIQGTPLLVILFLVFFGLPGIGITTTPLTAASIALIIYVSAYLGEIWRGCLEAVSKSQWEAAECLAMSRLQRMVYIILPQAFRMAIPPTVGFLVQIIKNTSLTSIVGFVELTRAGQLINNSLFEPFLVYSLIAALYFLMCFPVSLLSRRLEVQTHKAS